MADDISSGSSDGSHNVRELTIVDVDANFVGGSSTEQSLAEKKSSAQFHQRDGEDDEAQLPKPTELHQSGLHVKSNAVLQLDCDSSDSEAELDQEDGTTMNAREDSSSDYQDSTDASHKAAELLKECAEKDFMRRIIRLTKVGRFSEANELLMQIPDDFSGQHVHDKSRRTATHYAAMSTDGESTLLHILRLFGSRALLKEDYKSVTPLHLSLGCHSTGTVRKILSDITDSGEMVSKLLKTLKTSRRNTIAHYAASNTEHQDVLSLLVDSTPTSCSDLFAPNSAGQTMLHMSIEKFSPERIPALLEIGHTRSGCLTKHLKTKDQQGNSSIHYAAMRGADEAVLRAFEFFPKSFRWKNNKKQSVLQLVLQNCRVDTIKQMLRLSSELPLNPEVAQRFGLVDWDGNTWMHYAAMNENNDDAMFAALEDAERQAMKNAMISGSEGLLKQNKLGQTVLHCLAHREDEATLLELLPAARVAVLKAADDAGNTVLHLAISRGMLTFTDAAVKKLASDCIFWRNNKQQTVAHLAFANVKSYNFLKENFLGELDKSLKSLDASGRNPLFYASFNWNVAALEAFKSSDEMTRVDADGNTLMHALFMNTAATSGIEAFIKSLKLIAKAGVNPGTENSICKTCLQVCEIRENLLKQILEAAADTNNVGKLIKAMLHSSTGTHAVHLAATRYRLKDFVEPLACLSGIEASQLLSLTVSSGTHRGASCLHFACQAGHEGNIKFLIEKGLSLSSPTHDGLTPIDFACNSGKDGAVEKAFLNGGGRKTNLLRLLDLPKRALDLPDRETANRVLSSATEMSIIETALFLNKFKIIPDLVLTRQFELIPTCLKVLVELKRKLKEIPEQREEIKELRQKLKCIAFNAIDEMFRNASAYEQQLLFDYICGRMEPENSGPLFTCAHRCGHTKKDAIEPCTVLRLLLEADCDELFVSECMTKLADTEWKNRHSSLTRDLLPNDENVKKDIDVAMLILLTLVSIGTPLANGFGSLYETLYIFVFYGISTYVKLSFRLLTRSSLPFSSTNRAFSWLEVANAVVIVFGCAGALAFRLYYFRMLAATCFLVWGIRLISFLTFFEKTGPMVMMLVQLLLQDLLPFLSIILIVIYSFGIFFFHLLFPVPAGANYWLSLVQVFTLPLKLMFTNFDRIQFKSVNSTNLTGYEIGSMAYDKGSDAFYNCFMFVFLLLVNIVMVNLLIALFSLRVSKIASKSKIVWRRMYFDMLVECNRMSVVPSPLYLVNSMYFILLSVALAFRSDLLKIWKCGKRSNWWHSETNYPKVYIQFLKFQAKQFRRFGRRNLTRRIVDANSDPDGVQARADNNFAAVKRGIDSLDRTRSAATSKRSDLRGIEAKLDNLKLQSKRRRKQINDIEAKLDRLIQLVERR
uniref:ANK_REP_REGION domain-containing protein n=1 Tax=Macrostomum lignano TaxID=282301 RepID=A0A1I8JIP8_9PLAT